MRRTSLRIAVLVAAILCMAPAAASAVSWSVQATSDPAGAAETEFAGVSCASSTGCTAVGTWDDGFGDLTAFGAVWASGAWSLRTVPAPAGAVNYSLEGVSCTAVGACTAVGSWTDVNDVQFSLIARWNGTSWALQTPATVGGAQGAYLSGVSCTSSTACRAVGSYVDGSFIAQPLTMSWNGTTWTTQTAPTTAGHQGTTLSSISCTSSTVCETVGTAVIAGVPLTYAAGWNGTRWSGQTTPTPSGASATFLNGVSCSSSTACTSVGYSTDRFGNLFPIAQRWNGTTWTNQTPVIPAGATGAALSGVACTTSTACQAVGYSYTGGTVSPLAELWNGTVWSTVATPLPAGGTSGTLNGISCTSSVLCTGVGSWIDTARHALALRYS